MSGYIENDNQKPIINGGSICGGQTCPPPSSTDYDKQLSFLKDFNNWTDEEKLSLFNDIILLPGDNIVNFRENDYNKLLRNPFFSSGDVNNVISYMKMKFGRTLKNAEFCNTRYGYVRVYLVFGPLFSTKESISKALIPEDIKSKLINLYMEYYDHRLF